MVMVVAGARECCSDACAPEPSGCKLANAELRDVPSESMAPVRAVLHVGQWQGSTRAELE